MAQKSQFSIRAALIGLAILSLYFAFAARYGYGRAILCCFTVVQALSSIIFFVAAYHSHKQEHPRNALAATLLGVMILIGALLLAVLVFQPIEPPAPSQFDLG